MSVIVNRRNTDFCVLVLHPFTFMTVFISFKGLLKNIQFYLLRIISSVLGNLDFLFSICISFVSFSCLLAPGKNPSTILNRNEKSGHHYHFPDFLGIALSFSLFNMVSLWTCCKMTLLCWNLSFIYP